jgi:hypothetical protein
MMDGVAMDEYVNIHMDENTERVEPGIFFL